MISWLARFSLLVENVIWMTAFNFHEHSKKHEVYLQHMIFTELTTWIIVDLKKFLPTP